MATFAKTDQPLFVTTVALTVTGLVMGYSASSVMAQLRYGSDTYFFKRQLAWVIASVLAMMVFKVMPYRRLQNAQVAFAAVGGVVILLGLAYFLDVRHRWLDFGMLHLQPAEFAKPVVALFLAYFVAHRARAINDKHTVWPAAMAVGLVTVGVIAADLGTAVVLGITSAAVFYVAGLERRYFVALALVAVIGGAFAVVSKSYRLARVVQFFDPEYKIVRMIDHNGMFEDYLKKSVVSKDTNYQAEQSKIAVGAGGPAGLGLMRGKQKLLYLPEAHNDFIFSVICEEMGLLGSFGILAGFGVVFWRGFRAALRTEDDFARYLALSITIMVVAQACMNMNVALAMAPTKGITLPMISIGGSSLLSTLVSMGILMNITENA